jgi:hypothetical protein
MGKRNNYIFPASSKPFFGVAFFVETSKREEKYVIKHCMLAESLKK